MQPAYSQPSLQTHIEAAIKQASGWLPFDAFMSLALYAPGLGYYANGLRKFGKMPANGSASGDGGAGSDFVTAPELTPLFGQALAKQVAQALQHTGTSEVWEFGAGSGALAEQILTALDALGQPVSCYTIVDLSATLRERQQATLAAYGDKVRWADELPPAMQGVVIGNEVLDAMPVKLLARVNGCWYERGVGLSTENKLAWQDRASTLRPPCEIEGAHDYLTEIHPQAEAFMRTVAQKLQANDVDNRSESHAKKGAVFLIDYGFPESEYYHPQRHMGTVMCHLAHQSDGDPLVHVGQKDITAHVNFTGIALAAQEMGLQCLGYTSQGRFLLNCGLPELMASADLKNRSHAMKLINEHEMGELFKVIGFCIGEAWDALGFNAGDRTHTL